MVNTPRTPTLYTLALVALICPATNCMSMPRRAMPGHNHVCVLACPPLPLSGGAGDHLHRVLSVCNACMNHKITFAAHEDLRETFSKTLRYRVTNLSLQCALTRPVTRRLLRDNVHNVRHSAGASPLAPSVLFLWSSHGGFRTMHGRMQSRCDAQPWLKQQNIRRVESFRAM